MLYDIKIDTGLISSSYFDYIPNWNIFDSNNDINNCYILGVVAI